MIRRALLALGVSLVLASGGLAQCRQALALALDVSGSIDTSEYRLQMDGLAAALLDDGVMDLLMAMPSAPVDIAVFQWSGPDTQELLVDWTVLRSPADVTAIAARLAMATRPTGSVGTALGTAMRTGHDLLARRRDCWKLTLDISGDGKRNMGPYPQSEKPRMAAAGITVNALVIGADMPRLGDTRQVDIAELSAYFSANVIVGADAFVQTALGFPEYEKAMIRKLKRELEGLVIGRTDHASDGPGRLR